MTFIQHDDMVQAILPDAASYAFQDRIPPKTSLRRQYLFNTI
jgi:hypothetical protein